MTSITSLCSRAIHIDKGLIIDDGDKEKVVSAYLVKGSGGKSVCEWKNPKDAPGNHNIRLKQVGVFNAGRTVDQIENNKPVEIRIDFWNFQPGSRKVVEFKLYDSNGIVVIESFNTPEASNYSDPMGMQPLKNGLYRSTCAIPENFLNEGQFHVSVIIASITPPIADVDLREAVTFTIIDSGNMRTAGLSGRWHGFIRTPLSWKTELVEIGNSARN